MNPNLLADLRCLVCRGESVLWLTRGSRTMRRCTRCGLLWVPEGVATVDGVTIYEQDTPVFFTEGRDAYYLDPVNILNFEERYAWTARFAPEGELLDVGAAFGHFAAVAQKHRPVTAMELSPVAVRWAREQLSVNAEPGSVYDDRPDFSGRFSAITLWDVIEHVPDPEAALRAVRAWMRPDGCLFISTPDAGSALARTLGSRWHHVDPVQHLVLFGRRNLIALLERAGFRIRDVRAFGRIYNTRYIANKVSAVGVNSLPWRVAGVALRSVVWALPEHVRVQAGDVMGIAADLGPEPRAVDRA